MDKVITSIHIRSLKTATPTANVIKILQKEVNEASETSDGDAEPNGVEDGKKGLFTAVNTFKIANNSENKKQVDEIPMTTIASKHK